jgi:hypothetical protein
MNANFVIVANQYVQALFWNALNCRFDTGMLQCTF